MKRPPVWRPCLCLAERGGFEPPIGYEPIHAFQACDLNHSSISPECGIAFAKPHIIAKVGRGVALFKWGGWWGKRSRRGLEYAEGWQLVVLRCCFLVYFGVGRHSSTLPLAGRPHPNLPPTFPLQGTCKGPARGKERCGCEREGAILLCLSLTEPASIAPESPDSPA
jgi:hypothetical protein